MSCNPRTGAAVPVAVAALLLAGCATRDGVRRGTQEELDTLDLGGVADGMLPFSVDVSLRRLAGDDGTPAGTLESDLDVVFATGTPSLTAVEPDGPEPCAVGRPPEPFTSGTGYTSCVLVVAAADAEVTRVEFGRPGSPYEEDPVVWVV